MFLPRSTRIATKNVTSRRGSIRSARGSWFSGSMWLEQRLLLTGSLQNPLLIPIGSALPGNLTPGGADYYEVQPSSDGRLIAQTHAESGSLLLRLSLFDSQDHLLVQSDGQSLGRLDALIDQHVAAGFDILEVQSLAGAGAYSLSTSLTPASDPSQSLALAPSFQGTGFAPIAVGDFTNNGIVDIVAPDGVHLGTGDGTFEAPSATGALADPTTYPTAIAVGYFNGDRNLDVAVALGGTDAVSISLGNGDGTFEPATTIGLEVPGVPDAIVAGNFGNGQTDLAVAVADTGGATDDVVVLMGKGDGTFQALPPIPVGVGPVSIAADEFANNGLLDLAVADINSADVTILSNSGDGNFSTTQTIELPGTTLTSIVAGEFGTGNVDLAVTDASNSAVDILQGNGHGTFQAQPVATYAVGANPYSIVTGDFTESGITDLAVADANSNDVSVLLGNGDGTFQAAIHSPTANSTVTSAGGVAPGTAPIAIVAGDFNGDGRLDLATGNAGSSDISVLLGKGDGTFEEPPGNTPAGYSTAALTTGDFTGNGNLGVAIVDQGANSVTILPGNGDGTFQQPLTVALPQESDARLPPNPTDIVAADFNNDGRTDLAVTDPNQNEVDILLGNGDGTFQSSTITVPDPWAIAAGDFTGNGQVDLAVVDRNQSDVTILVGNGEGKFTIGQTIALVDPTDPSNPSPYLSPDAIVAGNFTNSGHLDLAVADEYTDAVTVLLGNGDGTFTQGSTISLGEVFPFLPFNLALTTGDFRNNGLTDLAVASANNYPGYGDTVDVLLGNDDGTFRTSQVIPLETAQQLASGELAAPIAIASGTFTSNGKVDLVTADSNGNGTDDYSVYLGDGDGTFQPPTPYALGGSGYATALATGDFAGNGRTDLALTRTSPDSVQVRLSNGDGTFSDPSVVDLVRLDTPLVADLNGDGAPDVSVVDAAGDILFRAGRPGEPGSFAPPVTVNPGNPSRGIAFVSTDLGPLLASVDANDNAISFFAVRSTGFVKVASLATGSEPAEILAADLDGNGVTDLIVRNAGDGTIWVHPGDGGGWFLPPIDLPVGVGASDIQVADLEQDGRLDIVYTDRLSGEVGVLENLGGGSFASPMLYRAGPGPYGVGTAVPSPVSSLEGTTSLSAGTFTSGGLPSLVALNPGSNTFGLLAGLGDGRLSNPAIFPTPGNPLVIRAVDFSGNGVSGLAILTSEGLYIEQSNGHGGFLPPTAIKVGFEPNGLTVADLNGDGIPDLLVSNPLGDVVALIGNGNGTFRAIQSLDQQVSMAVYTQGGSTPAAFIFADQLTDQLVIQTVGGGTTVLGNAGTGLISPGAVTLADLNNNGILDLIVANSGSNNVLVYPGLGSGTFGPALNGGNGFFTGTNPVGITVADVNGDGRPDLIIADKGSNDVSILINEKVGNGFTFVPGPRLKVGNGPVSTQVAYVRGSSVPDLLVANSGSNNVWLLEGIGNGFFNDQDPTVYPVGTDPSALFVGHFMSSTSQDLLTVNSGSDNVTLISGLGSGSPFMESISTGGTDPTAAFAVDLQGNGQDSLVVANNADGNIALLLGGENGLALSSVISAPGLPNPSALALASFNNDSMEFYATTDGAESATLLGFQLEETGALSANSSASSISGAAQLLSLNETSLALIGTLLTFTIESPSESEQTAEAAAAQAAASGPSSSGNTVAWTTRSSEDYDEFADLIASNQPILQSAPAWARYVSGVDQAIERVRSEADERLRQEQQPAKPEQPGTSFLDEDSGSPKPGTSTFLQPTAPRAGQGSLANRELLAAIDVAIGSWVRQGRTAVASVPLGFVLRPVTKSASAVSRLLKAESPSWQFPGLEPEHSQRAEIRVSRLAGLIGISLTAAGARQILLRRSSKNKQSATAW